MPAFDELVQQVQALSEEVATLRESRNEADAAKDLVAELRQQINDLRFHVDQHARFYQQDFRSAAPSIPTWSVREAADDPALDRPWRSIQVLRAGTHITIAEGVINCTLVAGDHIAITDNAIGCTLVAGTHITINGEEMDHDEPGEHSLQIAKSGVWQYANAWIDALGHVMVE